MHTALRVRKELIVKEDGRTVILYSFVPASSADQLPPERTLEPPATLTCPVDLVEVSPTGEPAPPDRVSATTTRRTTEVDPAAPKASPPK